MAVRSASARTVRVMMGLYFTGVVIAWLALLWWVTGLLTQRLARWKRELGRVLAFIFLAPLPLADELIGKYQFQYLCAQHSDIAVDRTSLSGRFVYSAPLPSSAVRRTSIPVQLDSRRFLDFNTGRTVISYNQLRASGGVLVRVLGFSEANAPLLFKGVCGPGNQEALNEVFADLDIQAVKAPFSVPGAGR